MTGSRRLEQNGETATTSSSLDKYLARPREELCSWYDFASHNGKVPVVSGGATYATWPLLEDYCRTMMLLHCPSWFSIQEVKRDEESWNECFETFLASDDSPTFVKAQVIKAQQAANHQPDDQYEENEDEDESEAVEQPDWVGVYASPNHQLEGVESEFQYDDGGDQFDWNNTSIPLPDVQQVKQWLQGCIEENEETNALNSNVQLPDVCPSTLNEEQRSIVS